MTGLAPATVPITRRPSDAALLVAGAIALVLAAVPALVIPAAALVAAALRRWLVGRPR